MQTLDWTKLSDKELLKVRIKDLGLSLEKSDLYPLVRSCLDEAHQHYLDLHPRVYIGDEWFSPDGYAAIAVPFFLLHPRLRKLEHKMMCECEGEGREEFSKLFRHELGHVFDHAFRVSNRDLWQKYFGSNKKPYTPLSYRPRPYSKSYVQNISDQYAQSHPDEDFAETFAVWLNPRSNWKKRYKGWGALKKLQYTDKLCKEFAGVYVPPPRGRMLSDAKHLNSTLEHYYQRKKRMFEDDSPEFYDDDLLKIFDKAEQLTRSTSAASFMRKNRKEFVDNLAHWTRERKIVISDLIDDFVHRSKELRLVLKKDSSQTSLELIAYLSTLLTNYRLTGKFKKVS